MLLKFVQYTAPQKTAGGYRWLESAGCEECLNEVLKLLGNVDWTSGSEPFKGGICLLPKYGMGVAFRKIKGLPSFDGRDKTTTNGVIFQLAAAAENGVNGIWELPALNDPAETGRELKIYFNPAPPPYPTAFAEVDKAVRRSAEAFFKITGDARGIYFVREVTRRAATAPPKLSAAAEKAKPFVNTVSDDATGRRCESWRRLMKKMLLLFFFAVLICGFIVMTRSSQPGVPPDDNDAPTKGLSLEQKLEYAIKDLKETRAELQKIIDAPWWNLERVTPRLQKIVNKIDNAMGVLSSPEETHLPDKTMNERE